MVGDRDQGRLDQERAVRDEEAVTTLEGASLPALQAWQAWVSREQEPRDGPQEVIALERRADHEEARRSDG